MRVQAYTLCVHSARRSSNANPQVKAEVQSSVRDIKSGSKECRFFVVRMDGTDRAREASSVGDRMVASENSTLPPGNMRISSKLGDGVGGYGDMSGRGSDESPTYDAST